MPGLIWTEFVNPKPINLGIRKELASPISQVSVCGLVLVGIKGLTNTPQTKCSRVCGLETNK